ncbi:MAG: hypothetical protein WC091_20305 [Sulfuricellaceae bacterium]
MKIVIQCAGSKNPTPDAGFRSPDNRLVKFVAHPKEAPVGGEFAYARPDDLSDDRQTWRERLLDYNDGASTNPKGLLRAYELYKNPIYKNLVTKFGSEQVFILSAGWGLISSDFLIPDYDITFSGTAERERYKRRKETDSYNDFFQLPDDGEPTIFLGGQNYLPLFCHLTAGMKGMKKVFFNSKAESVPGFRFERFETEQRSNWHYKCAQYLIDGKVEA